MLFGNPTITHWGTLKNPPWSVPPLPPSKFRHRDLKPVSDAGTEREMTIQTRSVCLHSFLWFCTQPLNIVSIQWKSVYSFAPIRQCPPPLSLHPWQSRVPTASQRATCALVVLTETTRTENKECLCTGSSC